MRIISKKRIIEAEREHAEWSASLRGWYKLTRAAIWRHFPDVKQTFGSADLVGDLVVFDISHNKCRLVAFIGYRKHLVFIHRIMSHADYMKGDWK